MHLIWDEQDDRDLASSARSYRLADAEEQLRDREGRLRDREEQLRDREKQLRDAEIVFRAVCTAYAGMLILFTLALVRSASTLLTGWK